VVGSELPLGSYTHNFGKHTVKNYNCWHI
jgi:hypothetical protein